MARSMRSALKSDIPRAGLDAYGRRAFAAGSRRSNAMAAYNAGTRFSGLIRRAVQPRAGKYRLQGKKR
jgi:hypothetical protein